jgi:hypothetical protein
LGFSAVFASTIVFSIGTILSFDRSPEFTIAGTDTAQMAVVLPEVKGNKNAPSDSRSDRAEKTAFQKGYAKKGSRRSRPCRF